MNSPDRTPPPTKPDNATVEWTGEPGTAGPSTAHLSATSVHAVGVGSVPKTPSVHEILALWEALRAQGQEASADTLCQAYPERKAEVARWLRVLHAVYEALGADVGE